MKQMQWLGVAVVAVGSVVMLRSGRLLSATFGRFVDLQAGQHIHVHWHLLIGMALVLGGGLLAQVYQPGPKGPTRGENTYA